VGVVKIPQKFLGIVALSSSISRTASTTSAASTPSTSTSPSPSSFPRSKLNSSSTFSGGVIAGIVLGAITFISLLTLALYFFLHKKRVVPSASSHPQLAEVEAPSYPPAYEVGSGQETASEKYAEHEPVELDVPLVELAGSGEYGRHDGAGLVGRS
jgi:hypothetical protein